jgi:hypothetical protein
LCADVDLVGCYAQVFGNGGRERSTDISAIDLESEKCEPKDGEENKVNSKLIIK